MTNVLEYILKLKDEASKNLKGFQKELENAEKGSKMFGGALVATGAAMTAAAGIGLKYAGELETLTIALETVTGSHDEAEAAMRRIKKTAADSPFFETATLAQFVQLMIAAGKETDAAVDSGIAFGDVMAAFGKGNAELSRLGNTLAQVIGKGKADTVDFKELVNAGWVSVRRDVSTTMGVTMEKLEEMVSAGKVGYDEIRKAADKYTGSADKQAGTLSSLTNRLSESFQTLAADVVTNTGIFESFKGAMESVIGVIDQNGQQIQDFISGGIKFAIDNIPMLTGAIVGGLTPALWGLAKSIWAAMYPLWPFIAAGAAVGLAVQLLVNYLGGWEEAQRKLGEALVFAQGKLQPFIDGIEFMIARVGQILGITGEFGTFINGFAVMAEKVDFYSQRIFQIISEYWQKIKNFIAFGSTDGDASIIQMLEGIWNRLQPLRDALAPILDQMVSQFLLAGEVLKTQVAPAFEALLTVLRPFAEAVLPYIIGLLAIAGAILAGLVATMLAIITGIASGLANALPYIAQAIEGIVQFFRGFIQLVTGLITLDWALAMEGLKQMAAGAIDFVTNGFMALLDFISGFIKGVIAFFQGLYDVLVGHSIVPDLVKAIERWFKELPQRVWGALAELTAKVIGRFTETWDAINNLLGGWPGRLMDWGRNIGNAFVDGIKGALDNLKGAFTDAFNKAKGAIEGNSPPKEGPLKDIDVWGYNIGEAWVNGMKMAMQDLSMPQDFSGLSSPAAAVASGTTNNYQTQAPINLTAVINNDMDAVSLAQMLGFEVSMRGRY